GGDGATPNDVNDGDSGANNLQNFPILTGASTSGGSTTVDGTLNSGPTTTYVIDFYAGSSCGAAQRYLGSLQTNTIGNNASFSATGLATTSIGEQVMATATDLGGDTSEISACVVASGPTNAFTVTNTNDSGAGSLRQAILDANAHSGADTIT